MNARCYRCGWSLSLSRETIEAAVASAGSRKIHVEHCPRCRQVIKIPIEQLKRTLPPGWTPESRPVDQAAGVEAAQAQVPEPAAPAAKPEPAAQPAAAAERPRRRKTRAIAAEAAQHLEEEGTPATQTQTETSPRPIETSTAVAPAAKTRKPAARKQPKS